MAAAAPKVECGDREGEPKTARAAPAPPAVAPAKIGRRP